MAWSIALGVVSWVLSWRKVTGTLWNPFLPTKNRANHCSQDSFLRSILRKSYWHPLKPLSTQHQQCKAIFRILVIFAHLYIAMGDPSTPNLNFYYLEHCFGNTFLSSMLKKIDWHPLKPVPTHYQQGKAIFGFWSFLHICAKPWGTPQPHIWNFMALSIALGIVSWVLTWKKWMVPFETPSYPPSTGRCHF